MATFLLHNVDLQKGDTVAVILPNIPEYGIIVLGSAEAGLKITTVNPSYTASNYSTPWNCIFEKCYKYLVFRRNKQSTKTFKHAAGVYKCRTVFQRGTSN